MIFVVENDVTDPGMMTVALTREIVAFDTNWVPVIVIIVEPVV